jgi:hypothetical protein
MKELQLRRGARWQLTFSAAGVPIFLELIKRDDRLGVYVSGNIDHASDAAIFNIDDVGVSIPEAGIAGALAAQYLFALDRALTEHSSQPKETE